MADSGSLATNKGIMMVFGVAGLTMIGANSYLINRYTADSQNAAELKSATTTVTIINLIFTLVLGAFAYITMSADPSFGRGYIVFMIHATLFISIIALSVSVLAKA